MARRKRKRSGIGRKQEGIPNTSMSPRHEEQGGVGARLRRAREARGLSLSDVAEATKISHTALEAIERDDLKRLPGGIFTRAFVRAYAQLVGLDPDGTLRAFLAQSPEIAVETGALPPPEPPPNAEPPRMRLRLRRIASAAGLPIAVVALYFLARPDPVEHRFFLESRPLRASRVPALAVDTPPPALGGPRVVPAVAVERPADGRIRVVLNPRGECWLSARLYGDPAVSRLLAAGEELTLEAKQEIVLKLGDAGAVSITVNGEPMRVLGEPGQVVTARISQDTLNEYLANP